MFNQQNFKKKFIIALDKYAGYLLARILPKPTQNTFCIPNTILIIRPGGIGDAVLLLPLVNNLINEYPDLVIDILAEKRNNKIFYFCKNIRNVYCYDHKYDLLKVLKNQYDYVIDSEQSYYFSSVVCRFIKSKIKIGFSTNIRSRMFTHTAYYDQDEYESDCFLRLVYQVGVIKKIQLLSPWFNLPAIDNNLEVLLPAKPYVVIFPGASIPEKQWGWENFRSVALWCLEKGLHVVLVGGDREIEDAEKISSGISVVNLVGLTNLEKTAVVVEHSSVLVSGDSGVLHFAAALDKPSVALFGPSSSRKWAPRGTSSILIDAKEKCSPCSSFGTVGICNNQISCMKNISVKQVIRAISSIIYKNDVDFIHND